MRRVMLAVRNKIAAVLGLIVALAWIGWQFAATSDFKSAPTSVASMPNLDGDKARDYLEKQGLSDSLSDALRMARYGVKWVDRTPVSNEGGAFEAKNPQQRFAAYFSDSGVHLVSRSGAESWNFSLTLTKYGDDSEQSLTLHQGTQWSPDKTKVSTAHLIESQITKRKSQIIELFENKPEGLEQSFVIPEKIDGRPLRLVSNIQGDLVADVSADGQTLLFTKPGGDTILRYDKLKSWDATGMELPSRMEVTGSELSLTVDDESAVYPVTVDPTFTQVKKLLASDGETDDFLGSAVAVSGDTAIVGAPGDNGQQGSAYVFQRNSGGANNWSEVKKLTASDGVATDYFGSAITLHDDTLIIGAPGGFPNDLGAAYIFERNAGGANNWGEVKKLLPVGGASFGSSVSLDDSTLVVGAEGFFDGESGEQGFAYIFDRNQGGANNWGLVKRIQAENGDTGDFFGAVSCTNGKRVIVGNGKTRAFVFERNADGIDNWGQTKTLTSPHGNLDVGFAQSISIEGETVVFGSPQDFEDENDDGRGAAYIFGRHVGGENNWGLIKRIIASDGVASDSFGSSVAMSGDRIIVGSPGDDIGANADQGSAYVFERNSGGADNWGQVDKIIAAGGIAQDRFGSSIALDGNTTIAGAPGLNFAGNTARGSAFVFVRTTNAWTQEAHPLPVNCTVLAFFGFSVAISGDTAVVGSPVDDVGSNADQGALYIFKRDAGGTDNWGLVRNVTASDGSSGDRLGWSVALSGNTIVAGAFLDDLDQGSAYVFDRNSGGPDNWGEIKKLLASDGSPSDFFGRSVGISGSVVVVGALLDDGGRGSAYIYERNFGGVNNWGEMKKLIASDRVAGDQFGISVSIGADTVLIGASRDNIGANSDQGSAYIFERNNGGPGNWGELRKLTVPDGAAFDRFGDSVAIDGDLMVIGASGDNVGTNTAQGSAYIFERNTGGANNWGQVKQIVAQDGAPNDRYGWSVAIDADTVVVGALNDQVGMNALQGSAYVFKQNVGGLNNWGQVKRIVSPDGAADDQFGRSVAISGDTAIVGAAGDDVAGAFNQGSAQVFESGGGTWNQQAFLSQPPPTNCGTDDNYGFAVAIGGDTAVISATADDVGVNSNQGSVYVLERNYGGQGSWGLVGILTASDGASNDTFGNSVAIDGDIVIVGAANNATGTDTSQGAAYIYERNNGGPNNFGAVKKLVASDGAALDVFGWSVSISGDTAVVGAYYGANVRPGAAYIFRQNSGGADNWGQIRKLSASDGATGDNFGWSVGISGDTVLVGSRSDSVGANSAQGSVYVYERNAGGSNNWGEFKKITAADGALGDHFGTSVSISGNAAIVGANTDDIGTNVDQGSAYIFERNTGGPNNWGQVKKLIDSTGETQGYFGSAVGISGDTVIVGSPFDNIGANAAQGSAFVFSQNVGGADNWGQASKLTAMDGAANDAFGAAVAVSGDNFLVGAYQANVPTPFGKSLGRNLLGGNQQGASYIFISSSLSPTAANVCISGSVATAAGGGISRVRVSLTDALGNTRTTHSNSFGHYKFDNVPAGHTYVITVDHKRYLFDPNSRVLNVTDELANVDFVADK